MLVNNLGKLGTLSGCSQVSLGKGEVHITEHPSVSMLILCFHFVNELSDEPRGDKGSRMTAPTKQVILLTFL